ncbi:MAG: HD domain-containing protein [Erysipelotrichia bacterium]|nr:HD domain-containing protein [Candidatus Riflebacteria bacterium]NCB39324.1 HD domain-containing protein [Erysipelotrichia bacterium]
MIVTIFNAILVILITWLSYRYFELRERVTPAEERYLHLMSGVSSIIDRIEGYEIAHAAEIAVVAEKIAVAAGMDPDQIESLKVAAMLHDIGESLLPRDILRIPQKLDEEKIFLMRTHPLLGELHLKKHVDGHDEVPSIIRWHHERWDGMGYPDNLKAEEIPLAARVLAIADAVSAMSHNRLYRDRQYENACEIALEIEKNAGTQFDPALAKIWVQMNNPQDNGRVS